MVIVNKSTYILQPCWPPTLSQTSESFKELMVNLLLVSVIGNWYKVLQFVTGNLIITFVFFLFLSPHSLLMLLTGESLIDTLFI